MRPVWSDLQWISAHSHLYGLCDKVKITFIGMQIYVNNDIYKQITMIITYKWIYFPMDPHESAARPVNYSCDNLHEKKPKKETVKT